VAQVVEHISGGILKLTQLSEDALSAALLNLEVLELDQHGGECLGDAIVKLSSEHPTNLVGAGTGLSLRRVANGLRRSHPSFLS
jgi:hypothetical protein